MRLAKLTGEDEVVVKEEQGVVYEVVEEEVAHRAENHLGLGVVDLYSKIKVEQEEDQEAGAAEIVANALNLSSY